MRITQINYIKLFMVFILMIFIRCTQSKSKPLNKNGTVKINNWINPLVFNNEFEYDVNFPIWYNSSLVSENKIYRITKRTYPRVVGDSIDINYFKNYIPKEKAEYYFDPKGRVDEYVHYFYYDDREIFRTHIKYTGNMHSSGFRTFIQNINYDLINTSKIDEFTTDTTNKTLINSSLILENKSTKKYSYKTNDNKLRVHLLRKTKNWNFLSIDSILKPQINDWIIFGNYKKPYKRFQVKNLVQIRNVYRYFYDNQGNILKRIKENHPFTNVRNFQYDSSGLWIGFIDSNFSNNSYISHTIHQLTYDEYSRPIRISHQKINDNENKGSFYIETFHYKKK